MYLYWKETEIYTALSSLYPLHKLDDIVLLEKNIEVFTLPFN